jgi:hypothetical protein
MFVERHSPDRNPPPAQPLRALLTAETSHLRALLITGLVLAAAVLVSIAVRPGQRASHAAPPVAAEKTVASK